MAGEHYLEVRSDVTVGCQAIVVEEFNTVFITQGKDAGSEVLQIGADVGVEVANAEAIECGAVSKRAAAANADIAGPADGAGVLIRDADAAKEAKRFLGIASIDPHS